MVLGRALDDSYSPIVRQNLTLVTVARLVTNSAFRYVIPFLGVLADGLGVRISRLGIALTVATLTGLLGTPVGRLIDRGSHRTLMVLGLLGMAGGTTVAAVTPNIWWFGAGLVLIGLAKLVFDVAMTGWVADSMHYPRDTGPFEQPGLLQVLHDNKCAVWTFRADALRASRSCSPPPCLPATRRPRTCGGTPPSPPSSA